MENTALVSFPPSDCVVNDEEEIQSENDSHSSNSREPLIREPLVPDPLVVPQPLVTTQPQLTRDFHFIYRRNQTPSDNFFMLTIIQLFCCSLIGCLALFCIIPALCFVIKARKAEMDGDIITMYSRRQLALIFNFIGFFVGIINIFINIYFILNIIALTY
ncbi:PREDICTED: uncharacterized protein LOC105312598 [Amphimedon queenslandica]|uniref:Uncharacterized protein n=1 Tax=Amphimedon queenslandica TaxID=400682 RepID=A0A1X7UYY8_AMPQE|nr:PREDICTED: uncharacterized protein LOC105312598 [Amphimedon queenslandica]|eukprot:XP_011403670.1 PREDICTED: uncharacterized protein LOC105312598 [Amphimedon queenslandica]